MHNLLNQSIKMKHFFLQNYIILAGQITMLRHQFHEKDLNEHLHPFLGSCGKRRLKQAMRLLSDAAATFVSSISTDVRALFASHAMPTHASTHDRAHIPSTHHPSACPQRTRRGAVVPGFTPFTKLPHIATASRVPRRSSTFKSTPTTPA